MSPPPLISAWSFANAGMLVWGIAVAIPLVIHLWNRRTRQVMPWAAMDFLLAAIEQHSHRLRMEQWILLVIRVAILGLFALALADPLLTGFTALPLGPESREREHSILVIDTSYSMAAQGIRGEAGPQTLFEIAQFQAVELIRGSRQGDGFTLITLGDPPQAVVANPVFEAEDMVREVNALQVGHQGANLRATLEEVEQVMDAVQRSHPAISHGRVIIFTDLGRTTWDAARSPELGRLIASLSEKADLRIRELGEASGENLAIESLLTATPLTPVHRTVAFEAEVHNYSLREQRRRIEFIVDGQGITQQAVVVPAEGSAVAMFNHRFEAPGQHSIEARIDDDILNLDNHRWLSVTTPVAIRVLCVEGRPKAARYVAIALAPRPDGTADFQPDVVPDNSLMDLDLQPYDCIVLCNISRFDDDDVRRLADFVQAGGGLITILGDQVQAGSYNESRADGTAFRQLLPATIGDLVRQGPHRLDPLQYQHTLVAAFRRHERSGLLTLPIWRYFQLLPQPGAETALAFTDGDPALLTRNIGRGRSVMLATAAETDSLDRDSNPVVPWSALVSWPSFPPLVHEMVNYSVVGRGAQKNFLVGQRWSSLVPRDARDGGSVIVDPNGQRQRAEIGSDAATGHVARLSGLHRIEHDSTDEPVDLVAVNLDTQEGNLSRLDAADLPSQFLRGIQDLPAIGDGGDPNQPSRLFRLVLAAVVLLVLAESAFAGWLGVRSL